MTQQQIKPLENERCDTADELRANSILTAA